MDRIGLCEVWSVLAHDYGLYGITERLNRMKFKPSPYLRYDTLDPQQQEIYLEKEDLAKNTGSYSSKIGR